MAESRSSPGVEEAGRPALLTTPGSASRWALLSFFLLAYAFSWAWVIPIAISGGTVRPGQGWPTHFPALAGPLLAAVVVTARSDGRAGLAHLARSMVKARVALRWWLLALSPLIVLGAALLIDVGFGQTVPSARDFATFSGLPRSWGVLGVAAAIFLINGFGEETGWRGYALPSLQRHTTPLRATIILSVLWAGWHAPQFAVVSTFRDFTGPILVGWFFGLFCGAVVLTWLYNRTGSVLLVAVWHTSYNLISGTKAATGLLAAVSTTLVIVLAIGLIVLEIRAGRHAGASVLGQPDSGADRP